MLFISQPDISKHIKALESHYKTTLFERKGNAIQFTTGGQLLLHRIREVKNLPEQKGFFFTPEVAATWKALNQLVSKGEINPTEKILLLKPGQVINTWEILMFE